MLSALHFEGLAERYRKLFNKFWKHFHYYSKTDWEALLNEYGFAVVTKQEYGSRLICTLNDFLVPFSALCFFCKKIFNRWIVLTKIRKYYIYPIFTLINHLIKKYEKSSEGGIIFFSLMKR